MESYNIWVDTSYLCYWTGFSTWVWYKREYDPVVKDDGSFDPMSDPEFKYEYEKRFRWNIFGSVKNYVPIVDKSKIYFAIDCSKKHIWRNHYLDTYKISRRKGTAKPSEFNWSGVFNYTMDHMLPKYSDAEGMKILYLRGAEGDDIIGVCVKKFKNEKNIIIASDHDLLQLKNYATIVTVRGDEVTTDLSVKDFLLQKILMGDSSDDIPSVFPRTGEKTALKYINNRKLLEDKFSEDEQYVKNFKRNLKLVSFNEIPKEIENGILKVLSEADDKVGFSEL